MKKQVIKKAALEKIFKKAENKIIDVNITNHKEYISDGYCIWIKSLDDISETELSDYKKSHDYNMRFGKVQDDSKKVNLSAFIENTENKQKWDSCEVTETVNGTYRDRKAVKIIARDNGYYLCDTVIDMKYYDSFSADCVFYVSTNRKTDPVLVYHNHALVGLIMPVLITSEDPFIPAE